MRAPLMWLALVLLALVTISNATSTAGCADTNKVPCFFPTPYTPSLLMCFYTCVPDPQSPFLGAASAGDDWSTVLRVATCPKVEVTTFNDLKKYLSKYKLIFSLSACTDLWGGWRAACTVDSNVPDCAACMWIVINGAIQMV